VTYHVPRFEILNSSGS